MVEEDPLNGDSTDDDGELRSITDGIRPGRAQVLPTSCEKRGCVKPPYAPKTTSPKNVLKPKVQKRTSLTPNSLAKAPSPVSEAPLRASLKRVLAAEEMAPFTTKQSLEEIEELQALTTTIDKEKYRQKEELRRRVMERKASLVKKIESGENGRGEVGTERSERGQRSIQRHLLSKREQMEAQENELRAKLEKMMMPKV